MRSIYSVSSLLLLAVLFLALTIISGSALRGMRVDLTEQGLYTLSSGSVDILTGLEEPVTLNFYFSEDASADFPMVRNFARRVQELLDEMSERAGGQLVVNRIDPAPFSEAEDRAAGYGLEAVPTGRADESLYLGIVGTNMIDGLEVLPFLSPAREQFLEYELMRAIHLLSRPDKPVVGLLDGLGMGGGFDMQTGRTQPPWAIHDQIHELFDVRSVSASDDSLPDGMDVLVLVHPQNLDADLVRDIEDFLADGGRLLAFVDPWAESAEPDHAGDPVAAMSMDRASDLSPLFDAWGLKLDSSRFVADAGLGLQISLGQGRGAVRHAGIVGVTADNMNSDDVITGELDAVNVATAGHLTLADDSRLTLEPLLQSSGRADLLDTSRLQFLQDPAELMDQMGATGELYVLAARLGGQAAYMQPEQDEKYDLNAIVVADADMLADHFWVSRQQFFGTTLLEPFAGNGDFVINAIDNLLGNAALISIRSRAVSSRPFTLVDSLRREAEQDLRSTEQRLEAELRETEQRLSELQQARGDTNLSILTEEQEAELSRFMDQRLEIRRQLRQVRHELDARIEALGTRLKIINIALMPIVVTAFALGLLVFRRRRAAASRSIAQ
ncbi:MAG TPA: Gldg family protein [Wenzhouxiangella sp.]|nr:Gldg family protein [Wenzhouxiangella sp.]